MKSSGLRLILLCFYLGLFPTANAQGLRITDCIRTTNGLVMKWTNAVAGQSYTLQSRERTTNSLWLMLDTPKPWPIVETQWNETIVSTQVMRLYRVVAVAPATRGKLLSATLVQSYTTSTLNMLFGAYGVPITAQFGVKFYKVVYETIDPLGGQTTASGGLFVPQNVGKALPLLSFQHGTTTLTNDVASNINMGDFPIGLVFGSGGYATVLPDFLGMGAGPGFHPYLHARSEATASADMLRAARRYCASNSLALNDQVFLAGYSQGGHATMALHRELEKYHTNEFTITASAPMAGPYDMSGVELNDLFSPRCPPNPYYSAYVLTAYQRVYSLAPDWAGLLSPPYNTTIPPLFDGKTGGSTINNSLPTCNLSTIVPAEVLASLQHDANSPLRQALRENDLYQWKPIAPMRMYHCSGDADVLYANSQVAYSNFLAQGAAQVQLIDPQPGADHGGCVIPSLSAAKAWFDSLKQ
jgi:pimeloyl-ACP methyl ester carboxylesterase